jgi:hypothetical protein
MRSERGQAAVEWIGLLLLVALVLAALSHVAHPADGRDLGNTLARSVTGTAARASAPRPARSIASPGAVVPRLTPRPLGAGGLRRGGPVRLPELPSSLRRAGRGAGALWKRAWFACLAYERTRYALLHPESRFPGYTLPFDVALRMVNNCVSPVDLVRDIPELDPSR